MRKSAIYLLLSAIIFLNIHNSTKAQLILIQGEQSGILYADSVMVVGNVSVPSGESLTFLPGTQIIMTGFFGFSVAGSINASGSDSEPVRFTVSDTTGFYDLEHDRGGWNGFHFFDTDPQSDSSIFSHCEFEFGKAFGDSLQRMGGIFNIRNFGKIRLSNCKFSNNKAVFWGGAIFTENSNILIIHSDFYDNSCGTPDPPYGYGGAVCLRFSNVDIINCNFDGNSSTGIGGAVSFEYSDILVQTCIFNNNYSALGGALGYLRSNPAKHITNNLFTNNGSLFFGGAISCNKANPHFINNTISDNYSSSYGGGFYCNDSAAPVLINTILYGNHAPSGSQVYIWDVYSAPEFYYCNVQDGPSAFGGTGGTGFIGPYVNNIDTLPSFKGTWPHPFSLADSSACINAGDPDTTGLRLPVTDLGGNPRFTGERIDIGAYENLHGITGIRKLTDTFSIRIYPNPIVDFINIQFPMVNETAYLKISDLNGKTVKEVHLKNTNTFQWDCLNAGLNRTAPGIYLVTIKCGGMSGTARLICLPN